MECSVEEWDICRAPAGALQISIHTAANEAAAKWRAKGVQ